MHATTAALVGATGGAGTTRLALEFGATLARDGRDVAILDAAFATEGLARHVSGRVDPDLTELLVDDDPVAADRLLAEGLDEHPVTAELSGRLELGPARAPFERLARAKTAEAAQRFGTLLDEAGGEFDHVLVDVPPVAENQAVAAVTAADRVAVLAPASERGVDALQRTRGRVADVGASVDAVVANRAPEGHPVRSADATVPESEATTVDGAPASVGGPEADGDPESEFAPAVARATAAVVDAELTLEFEEPGLLEVDPEELLPDALSGRT
ncbi:ParA family protein [Halorussus halobius]|uniref:ParA family protein n=1 Tax=Halorussus halobius TaxID=1710537 RepID=UPI001091B66B|nr:ParA family protein [Halorussus halobius]